LALDALAAEKAEAILNKVVQQAESGTPWAVALLLSRIWPKRREREAPIELPRIVDVETLAQAQLKVLADASGGEIATRDAASYALMIETCRRALHTRDQERRLEEIEQAIAAKAGSRSNDRDP
jgi:hypothetical protein